ncbi:hypothetical protein ACRAQ7_06835 [Erythrobacter sp. W53]|uniref:hypothetical protein n=1 Tax=Erythrobacteraceae TaxID=335929 RepID=UPI0036D20994
MQRPTFYRFLPLFMLAFLWALATNASATTPALIANKIVTAYGGEKLRDLRSIRIQDDGLYSEYQYGFTPNFYEYDVRTTDLEIDFASLRGSYDYRLTGDRFAFHNRTLSLPDGIAHISYAMRNYEPSAFENFYQAFGASMRTSDTLIAKLIALNPEGVTAIRRSSYLGREHHIAQFDFPGSSPVELYVDANTGFLTRMNRQMSGPAKLTYLWSNHARDEGLVYGTLFQLHVDDHLEAVVTRRRLTANMVTASAFRIDSGISREPDRLEMGGPSDRALSDTVHLTGQDGSYSLFIDAGDHIVAVGTTRGFRERFERYSAARGHTKPLKYAVAAQHAAPHLSGISDAVALGARIIAHASHAETIARTIGAAAAELQIIALDSFMQIGEVEIHAVVTTHAEQLALVYLPEIRAVYQTDSYGNSYGDAPGFAGIGGVTLKSEIDRLKLDVETILFVYSPWPDSYSNFGEAVERYVERPCYSTRAMCSGW